MNFVGNAHQCKQVETLILNHTESTGAEIATLKGIIDAERDNEEINFNNMTKKHELLTADISLLASRIDQIDHKMDDTDRNISSKLSIRFCNFNTPITETIRNISL